MSGWAASNQLKAFREETEVPRGGGNSASRLPGDSSCNISSSLGLRLWSCLADLGLARPYNLISQFLKIRLPLSLSLSMYTHPVASVFFWRTLATPVGSWSRTDRSWEGKSVLSPDFTQEIAEQVILHPRSSSPPNPVVLLSDIPWLFFLTFFSQ